MALQPLLCLAATSPKNSGVQQVPTPTDRILTCSADFDSFVKVPFQRAISLGFIRR